MKLFIFIFIIGSAYLVEADSKRYSPLYQALTQDQIYQIRYIENDNVSSRKEVIANVKKYILGIGANFSSLYDNFMNTQRDLLDQIKVKRNQLIDSANMTSTAKAAQKKIDQASMDLSISRNDEREKIRQIRFSLTENERRELNDFQHGRLNNFVIGRTRNGNRNDHGYNVNFDYIYDIV